MYAPHSGASNASCPLTRRSNRSSGSRGGHNARSACYPYDMNNGTRTPVTRSVGSIIKGTLLGSGLLLGSQLLWVIALVLMAIWLIGALGIMLIWILVALLASVV